MVDMVALPLAMGWFSRRLAEVLRQGLGYRRAGLESQPVLPFLALEGDVESSMRGPLGTPDHLGHPADTWDLAWVRVLAAGPDPWQDVSWALDVLVPLHAKP